MVAFSVRPPHTLRRTGRWSWRRCSAMDEPWSSRRRRCGRTKRPFFWNNLWGMVIWYFWGIIVYLEFRMNWIVLWRNLSNMHAVFQYVMVFYGSLGWICGQARCCCAIDFNHSLKWRWSISLKKGALNSGIHISFFSSCDVLGSWPWLLVKWGYVVKIDPGRMAYAPYGEGETIKVDSNLKTKQWFLLKLFYLFLGFRYPSGVPKLFPSARIVLSALEEDAQSFRFASSELHADRDVMLAAVRRNGLALQFAVEELRDNQEILGVNRPTNIIPLFKKLNTSIKK